MTARQPGLVKLFRGMNLGRRFVVLGLLVLALIGLQLYIYLREANKVIEVTALERAGVPVIEPLLDAARTVQKQRGIATSWLAGVDANAGSLDAVRAEADRVIAPLERLVVDSSVAPEVTKPVGTALVEWKSLSAAVSAKALSVDESRRRHSALINNFLDSAESAADAYGLTLDPEAPTYYLAIATIIYMPGLSEAMARLRAQGADALTGKSQSSAEDERVRAATLADRANYLMGRADQAFAKAIRADAGVESSIRSAREEAATQVKAAILMSRAILVEGQRTQSAAEYRAGMNAAIESQFKLNHRAIAEIASLLDAREGAQRREKRFVLALLALLLAAGTYLAMMIIRSVVAPLADAMRIAEGVAAGNLDIGVEHSASDEVGVLIDSMKAMQEKLKSFVAAQVEMKRRHEAGLISHRIDSQQFTGRYREMAEQVNELVASHIADTMRVVEVVQKYAIGDLSVELQQLPGEKARITDAIAGVKESLQTINLEIARLVKAAASGDLKVRGEERRYTHEFAEMVKGLNQLMEVSDCGLSEVSRVLGAMARGDLTERISNDYEGTFGQLKDDANQTVAQLADIVGQIRDASDAINTSSKEIASGNSDLSQRTERQAGSLEETANSMEELTSTVRQNAENARQANQLAIGASDVAIKGGQVVGLVVATMGSINESSKKIADIIAVIDGIAFQTNILALNAAVEAARAGEQGRGFAVVATEVRNLAQRSAAAAKEIKELISDSVEKVGNGTQLVDEAGKTMEEIVTSIKRVTDIMSEITAASEEQSEGIEQVGSAITEMDEVTQQNAALVEQAAAAAESLQEQAYNLTQAVAVFRLGAGDAVQDQGSAGWHAPVVAANTEHEVVRPQRRTLVSARVSKPLARAKTGTNDDWSEF